MNKAFIRNQSIAVAGKWNELERAQLLRLMHVLLRHEVTDAEVNSRLVAILLQLWKRPQLAGIMRSMPLLEAATLRLLTKAFLNQPVQLTRQLLPTLSVGRWKTTFYGPGDELSGFTYEEWIAAEDAYYRYRQGDTTQITRLVAVLYRPGQRKARANGDHREEFNQHVLDARAEQLASLSGEERYAILYYYDSCRSVLVKRSPDLFPGKEYEDDPDPEPTNPTPGYLKLLRTMAGSPDRFDTIGKQPVQNVFYDLNERIAESNALAEQLAERSNG